MKQIYTIKELKDQIAHLDDNDQVVMETVYEDTGDTIDLYPLHIDVIDGIELLDGTKVREVRFVQRHHKRNTIIKDEIYRILEDALCNAVGTGYMLGYGIGLAYDEDRYNAVTNKDAWEPKVIQQLKDGGWILFKDELGKLDSVKITDENLRERFNKYVDEKYLHQMALGVDDATTADCILQQLMYGDIVFA